MDLYDHERLPTDRIASRLGISQNCVRLHLLSTGRRP